METKAIAINRFGIEVGKVEYNPMFGSYMVVINGDATEWFDNIEEAIESLEKSFSNPVTIKIL